MKTRFILGLLRTRLCVGFLAVLIPLSMVAQREGRVEGAGRGAGAGQARQPVAKPAGKPAQGGTNQRPANTKPADNNRTKSGDKSNVPAGNKNNVSTGDRSNVSGGNKNNVSTGNKTNVSGNNVNVDNSRNNVNVNNSKNVNVNVNKSTVVVANPRPYSRPPYAYGGHAYYCYHPYAYHPYTPYRWGPVWHPVGFVIATMAATAIIVTVASQQYHYDQGVYYVASGSGYTVVPAPVGATITTLPPGSQTVVINETTNNYY